MFEDRKGYKKELVRTRRRKTRRKRKRKGKGGE
jgi:hypothetical protein